MKKLNFILLFVLVAGATFLLSNQKSLAVSASDWKPGRIIDDVVFQNKQAMTVQQIQQFLDSKVPTCDRWGTLPMWSGGPTRAQWSADNGRDLAPYTCLKEYVENPSTKANNGADPTISVPGGLSAAQLIYNASQVQNINPQVYLVLLQKEQSLVTDDWPYAKQFERATGNNCPDTAPCDPAYAWLSTQVNNAGAQFNYYVTHFNQYNYAPGWNNILYNPNTACGRQSVYIENAFTAALYIYTPYVPNQAALNNMYGTGDGCSAYGNRNFWRLFNDWFGSSLAPNYSWTMTEQYAYTDQTKTVPANLTTLLPGQRVYVGFKAKNTGNTTWSNTGSNPTRVGMTRPYDRNSEFFDSSWLGQNRPTTLKESQVSSGEIGTFEYWMTAPSSPGVRLEYFSLLTEGVAWFNDPALNFYTKTVVPVYTWQLAGQYAFNDQTLTIPKSLVNLEPGERVYMGVQALNTGNTTWTRDGANPVHIGISNPYDRYSPYFDSTWIGQNRPGRLKEQSVSPGQIGTFEFWMTAPYSKSGVILEYLNLVVEGRTWMNNIGLNFYTSVKAPSLAWNVIEQYAYTDESKNSVVNLFALQPGQRVYVGVKALNSSNITWKNASRNPVRLATTRQRNRASLFCDLSSWINCSRPSTHLETDVPPGQIGTFEFWMTAPHTSGVSQEYYSLVSEGYEWFNDPGLHFNLRVIQQ